MDDTTALLSTYACGLSYDDLPPEVVHQVKRTLVDTFACALGGFGSDSAAVARRMAGAVTSDLPATILGTADTSTPDLAGFANSVMVRYLDCNDVYFSSRGNGAHPSDMIPAVLAIADPLACDGRTVIVSIALAYEVLCRFCNSAPFSNLGGWDYGMFSVIGAACGAGKAMNLDRKAMAEAISLAIVPNVPLGVTRTGALSMWKGCASAYATRAGIFAAQLAREGMTGPSHAFDGPAGLWDQVAGQPVVLERPSLGDEPFQICKTSFKVFPAQSHTQGPAGVALTLRPQLSVSDIVEIRIHTYGAAVTYGAGGKDRWEPKTRETADHSIPYLVATALLDGEVTPGSFTDEKLQSPAIRQLISTMVVEEDPEYTKRFPDDEHCRMEITVGSGRRFAAEATHPKGHWQDPLSDAEVEAKLHRLGGALPEPRRRELLRQVWSLDEAPDIHALLETLGAVGTS